MFFITDNSGFAYICNHKKKGGLFPEKAACLQKSLFLLCILLFLVLFTFHSGTVQAAGNTVTLPQEGTKAPVSFLPRANKKTSASSKTASNTEKPKKKGWVTDKEGNRISYHKNYKPVKGLVKIGKYYYYFNKKGILQKGTVKVGKTTYYIKEDGKLRVRKVKNVYYYYTGEKMTEEDAEEWKTILRAEALVKDITNPGDSQETKLLKCFQWCMKKPYRDIRRFHPWDGWTALHANDLYLRGTGECHAYASAFAYMAVVIGYKNVYVCNDSDGTRDQGHCWCEIGGYVYDPLFADTYGLWKYYGRTYSGYCSRPVLKVKVPYMSPLHAG